jgi:hypothetical protein
MVYIGTRRPHLTQLGIRIYPKILNFIASTRHLIILGDQWINASTNLNYYLTKTQLIPFYSLTIRIEQIRLRYPID